MPIRTGQGKPAGSYRDSPRKNAIKQSISPARPVEGGRAGLSGGNFQAGLGQQLSSRVDSGAISQSKAKRTAKERAILEQAYGTNWRQHVYGDRGYMKRTRAALTAEPDNPEVQQLYSQLMARRKEMLERARQKLGA